MQNGIDLYNGGVNVINYHPLGRCGSCTVKVEGDRLFLILLQLTYVSPSELTEV